MTDFLCVEVSDMSKTDRSDIGRYITISAYELEACYAAANALDQDDLTEDRRSALEKFVAFYEPHAEIAEKYAQLCDEAHNLMR